MLTSFFWRYLFSFFFLRILAIKNVVVFPADAEVVFESLKDLKRVENIPEIEIAIKMKTKQFHRDKIGGWETRLFQQRERERY